MNVKSERTFLFKERFLKVSIANAIVIIWVGAVLMYGYRFY